jgi:hypothetical protein
LIILSLFVILHYKYPVFLRKRDFDPLLPYGYKEIGIHELDRYFLEPFVEKEWRLPLVNGFRRLLTTLSKIKIEQEIWIDGSFVTTKPDPNDIDILLIVKQQAIESIPPEYKTPWESIVYNPGLARLRFECDLSFRFKDVDSERQQVAKYLYDFTHGHYGAHNKKGIFKLVLNRGNDRF